MKRLLPQPVNTILQVFRAENGAHAHLDGLWKFIELTEFVSPHAQSLSGENSDVKKSHHDGSSVGYLPISECLGPEHGRQHERGHPEPEQYEQH